MLLLMLCIVLRMRMTMREIDARPLLFLSHTGTTRIWQHENLATAGAAVTATDAAVVRLIGESHQVSFDIGQLLLTRQNCGFVHYHLVCSSTATRITLLLWAVALSLPFHTEQVSGTLVGVSRI